MEEIEFVELLPLAVPLIVGLRAELRTYKKLADEYKNEDGDG